MALSLTQIKKPGAPDKKKQSRKTASSESARPWKDLGAEGRESTDLEMPGSSSVTAKKKKSKTKNLSDFGVVLSGTNGHTRENVDAISQPPALSSKHQEVDSPPAHADLGTFGHGSPAAPQSDSVPPTPSADSTDLTASGGQSVTTGHSSPSQPMGASNEFAPTVHKREQATVDRKVRALPSQAGDASWSETDTMGHRSDASRQVPTELVTPSINGSQNNGVSGTSQQSHLTDENAASLGRNHSGSQPQNDSQPDTFGHIADTNRALVTNHTVTSGHISSADEGSVTAEPHSSENWPQTDFKKVTLGHNSDLNGSLVQSKSVTTVPLDGTNRAHVTNKLGTTGHSDADPTSDNQSRLPAEDFESAPRPPEGLLPASLKNRVAKAKEVETTPPFQDSDHFEGSELATPPEAIRSRNGSDPVTLVGHNWPQPDVQETGSNGHNSTLESFLLGTSNGHIRSQDDLLRPMPTSLLQRRVLAYLIAKQRTTGLGCTPLLSRPQLAYDTGINLKSIKTTVNRLCMKGLVVRVRGLAGRGDCGTIYQIPDNVAKRSHLLGTYGHTDTDNSPHLSGTQQTAIERNRSQYLSAAGHMTASFGAQAADGTGHINGSQKTLADRFGHPADGTSDHHFEAQLHDLVGKYELSDFGVGASDLLDVWHRDGEKFKDSVDLLESIEHLSFYLQGDLASVAEKSKEWMLSKLRCGYFSRPVNFVSFAEKQEKARLEDRKARLESARKLRREVIELEFEEFLLSLDSAAREQILSSVPSGDASSKNTREFFKRAFCLKFGYDDNDF